MKGDFQWGISLEFLCSNGHYHNPSGDDVIDERSPLTKWWLWLAENHHDVVYDVDWIVQRTFSLQHSLTSPVSASSSPSLNTLLDDPGPASRLQQTLPPSVSITPVYKRRSSDVTNSEEEGVKRIREEAGVTRAGITLYNETSITPRECSPAWSLGCLYKCQICQVNN